MSSKNRKGRPNAEGRGAVSEKALPCTSLPKSEKKTRLGRAAALAAGNRPFPSRSEPEEPPVERSRRPSGAPGRPPPTCPSSCRSRLPPGAARRPPAAAAAAAPGAGGGSAPRPCGARARSPQPPRAGMRGLGGEGASAGPHRRPVLSASTAGTRHRGEKTALQQAGDVPLRRRDRCGSVFLPRSSTSPRPGSSPLSLKYLKVINNSFSSQFRDKHKSCQHHQSKH